MKLPAIEVNVLDPEGSLKASMAWVQENLDYFEQDDGRIIALTYSGDDDTIAEYLSAQKMYAMIRPEKDQKQKLDTFDVIVNTKSAEDDPTNLQKFIAQGFEITGYVDNRYTDVFGLVRPNQHKVNGLSYITPEEADEFRIHWYSDIQPGLDESKKEVLEFWHAYKANVEALQKQDWSAVKAQALSEINNTQHPKLN